MELQQWFKDESAWADTKYGENNKGTDPCAYWVGYADYGDRQALMLIVEAARKLCATRRGDALKLLAAAMAEVQKTVHKPELDMG